MNPSHLLADEDFDGEVVRLLRIAGYDIVTIQELDKRGSTDTEVLALAVSLCRTVMTFNKWDYVGLHKRQPDHEGILVCSRDPDELALAGRIHKSIQHEIPLRKKLLRINRDPA